MKYSVIATPRFKRLIKKLVKKYTSLGHEYFSLVESLENQPKQGVPIGNDCFKIRLAIKSKGKGKSGGARVITYLAILEGTIYLLAIYDKSEMTNMPESELRKLLDALK